MIKNYPIKINNESIPFPTRWEENPKRIANNFDTESGGRKQIILRYTRLAVSGEWKVSSRWLKKFLQYRNAATLTVQIYDAVTNGYVSHTMGIDEESFSYELIPESKLCGNTNGLYRLRFDLEEF